MFELDHRLDNDSEFIADWGEFSIRLMKDERFFWLLIIPRLTSVTEWHELPDKQVTTLTKLISYLSKQVKHIDKADKMNVATLGNIVGQFHLHLIARHSGDVAWPGPVWGTGKTVPLTTDTQNFRTKGVLKLLANFSP